MQFKHKGLTVTIEQDSEVEDPRKEFDHMGTMVCFHGRYNLGDETHYRPRDFAGWEAVRAAIEEEEKPVAILPIYMCDHSGITIRTTPFDCPWDSGQIGFIFATKQSVLQAFGRKRVIKKLSEQVEQALLSEVEMYDQFVRGDVYQYTIKDDAGECLGSLCGCYGFDYCKQAAIEECEGLAFGSCLAARAKLLRGYRACACRRRRPSR